MEELIIQYQSLIRKNFPKFKRFFFNEIHWESRLIGMKGARGTGKTTMLLQWLKEQNLPLNKGIYISLKSANYNH